MLRTTSLALSGILAASYPASAGWLSDALSGKPPPVVPAATCLASPALCAGIEAKKEDERKKAIEEENRNLRDALAKQQKELSDLITTFDIKSEQERAEIRQDLSDGEVCFANAQSLQAADNCFLSTRDKVMTTHRKFAS